MRRAVEKYLEDPLAEEFLRGNIKHGDALELHAAGEKLAFKVGWIVSLVDQKLDCGRIQVNLDILGAYPAR
jgi:hypothetical protein